MRREASQPGTIRRLTTIEEMQLQEVREERAGHRDGRLRGVGGTGEGGWETTDGGGWWRLGLREGE